MSISVPSRFACLKIEDDDFHQPKKTERKKQQQQQQQQPPQHQPEKPAPKRQQQEKPNGNIKKPSANKNVNKKDKKAKVMSDKQWQEWKEKDDEFVNGNFQQDLQSAILLSTLDFEEKKDVYDKGNKDSENNKKTADKKKKNKTMSLDQFLGSKNKEVNVNGKADEDSSSKSEKAEKDETFFERIDLQAQGVLTKEKRSEDRKMRELNIDEVITIAHYQEKLKKEREKNAQVCEELERLKKEIAAVKARNKTLCGILGHGEMKEKADVLVELERLNNVKNELTDEVERLHVLLEQERSKVAALTSETQKHKDKKHKKH